MFCFYAGVYIFLAIGHLPTRCTLLPRGSPFGDPGPHGDLFQFLGPQKVPISFPRSPFSPFQAEERAKSQSSHCLLNVDHLNTCDDNTSLNELSSQDVSEIEFCS